ncbi:MULTISPECIES: serine/threonine-protein kinase [Sorangium]|uniref:Protein kinase n=1 Tax=Sorangium cellulosum TaxID=56 RepID=A0A4P2QW18_SORCE|nr:MULTISPECIES: serine/threonine-protein kinase [Sorangium]AUX34667.1 protein kinase [Sorangium cellulosum]WCQ93979.1 serine-threonine kinase [Sorangium sp. Soce836]
MSKLKTHEPVDAGGTIAGKYRLVEKIGEGAMGSVWSAINIATGREVALKRMIRPEPELRLRFEREARSCGALQHRNIVDVYDRIETAGEPFLVMQLLSGETLADLLARRRRVEPEIGAAIGRDVARGLAAAHALHIVHRDLKPSNIFLHREPGAEGWVVKVLDFGVAKDLSASDGLHTMPGGAVGSPLYMSPEQVRADRDIDHRSDIWSLGIVLFEMLTGERPFRGDATAVFAAILTGEIPSLARTLWRADRRLVDIVARCMRRDREERFGTAAEIAERLGAIATTRGALSAVPGNAREETAPPEAPAQAALSTPASGADGTANATDASEGAASHRPDPGTSTTPLIASSTQVSPDAGILPPGAPRPPRPNERLRRNPWIAAAALALGALAAAALALSGRPPPRAASAPPQGHLRAPEPTPSPEPHATTASPPAPPPPPAQADETTGPVPADEARMTREPPAPAPTSKQHVPAPSAGTPSQKAPSPRRPPAGGPCVGKTGFLRTLCLDKHSRRRSPDDRW